MTDPEQIYVSLSGSGFPGKGNVVISGCHVRIFPQYRRDGNLNNFSRGNEASAQAKDRLFRKSFKIFQCKFSFQFPVVFQIEG